MRDGTSITYDVYRPSGGAPAGGWPGVVLLHGLGGSKDDMAPFAQILAAHGYAALAYSARGEGTSTGNLELSGPKEISDERALESFFARLPNVSNTKIGGWGVSYGGGELWDGLAAGIPYKAAAVVATWTDLYSALWPQDVAKSGIVAGFAGAVDARSPLVTGIANDAVRSTNLPALRSLAAERSSLRGLPSVRTPVYIFQGRVDYAFDVTQAENGFLRVRGPKHLYIGQFGHPPSTFATADLPYVQSQTLACRHRSVRPLVGFRGATLGPRTGPRFRRALETFGVSVLRLQVRKVSRFPRLVATVRAGSRVITHGGPDLAGVCRARAAGAAEAGESMSPLLTFG
jgi:predicted acyl esterase